ncbi:MAG: glycosyltransferase [Patescibacteria group bacterium]|mgnify:CR=1 FL=1
MSRNLLVSVIITTLNSQSTLPACLKSITKQRYMPTEILVVDNNSTDETRDIARKYTQRVYIHGPERSFQRNYGAKKAKGTYFLFLDADMELTPRVIEECVSEMSKNSNVGAVTIPERSKGEGFWAACKTLERQCYMGDPNIEAARFFNRNIFWQFGGYDESMTGPEDWDLPYRIRSTYTIDRIQNFIAHNEGDVKLSKLAMKKFYYGKSATKYIKRHFGRAIFQQVFYFLRPSLYRNWRLLVRRPHLAFGMMIMLTVEQCAGAAGFLWGNLMNRRQIIYDDIGY